MHSWSLSQQECTRHEQTQIPSLKENFRISESVKAGTRHRGNLLIYVQVSQQRTGWNFNQLRERETLSIVSLPYTWTNWSSKAISVRVFLKAYKGRGGETFISRGGQTSCHFPKQVVIRPAAASRGCEVGGLVRRRSSHIAVDDKTTRRLFLHRLLSFSWSKWSVFTDSAGWGREGSDKITTIKRSARRNLFLVRDRWVTAGGRRPVKDGRKKRKQNHRRHFLFYVFTSWFDVSCCRCIS